MCAINSKCCLFPSILFSKPLNLPRALMKNSFFTCQFLKFYISIARYNSHDGNLETSAKTPIDLGYADKKVDEYLTQNTAQKKLRRTPKAPNFA